MSQLGSDNLKATIELGHGDASHSLGLARRPFCGTNSMRVRNIITSSQGQKSGDKGTNSSAAKKAQMGAMCNAGRANPVFGPVSVNIRG